MSCMERVHPRNIGSRRRRIGALARINAVALALALGASACTDSAPQAGAATVPAGTAVIPVITQAARVEPMGIEIEAVGTTQANESVELTSKASNTVTAIRFREGDEVERGTVLVEMDDAQARAALAEAEAALARSKSKFDRSRDLQSRQALSVADFEQVEADLKADEARVAAARSRLDDTVIRAAFKGRTGFRHVSVGSFVSPGALITTLDDTSIIKLDFTVPETNLFVLRRGLPVVARAAGLPDRTFTGTISNMDSRVDPVTRSVTVRARLDNPDGVDRKSTRLNSSHLGI